jgi:hypothetical protein
MLIILSRVTEFWQLARLIGKAAHLISPGIETGIDTDTGVKLGFFRSVPVPFIFVQAVIINDCELWILAK